jgi:hypothetical protein
LPNGTVVRWSFSSCEQAQESQSGLCNQPAVFKQQGKDKEMQISQTDNRGDVTHMGMRGHCSPTLHCSSLVAPAGSKPHLGIALICSIFLQANQATVPTADILLVITRFSSSILLSPWLRVLENQLGRRHNSLSNTRTCTRTCTLSLSCSSTYSLPAAGSA